MGHNDDQIRYIRENFEKKYAERIAGDTYDDRDVRRLRTDDTYVRTFIRGPQRLDEGVDLVHESLKFRKEYDVNDLTTDTFDQWMWDKHALFSHGSSKSGHKILYLRVKAHKKDAAQLPLVKKFFVFWLETFFKANPLKPMVILFDMSDAGLGNLDMDLIRFVLTCFKMYYPTFLEKLLIYEMPWIFNAAWKVIKTWLSAEAISKIKFATRSDIHTYINQDQLFEHMGGTCDLASVDYCPMQKPQEDGAEFSDPSERRKVTFSESTESRSGSQTENANNNAANQPRHLTSPRTSRSRGGHCCESESSYAGRLLTICPAEELNFSMDDNGEFRDIITLTNTLMYPIAFKVKTTAPEKYRVRPSTGVVKPGDAFEVFVYVQPGYITSVDKDKFLVMAIEVKGNYDASLWKSAPKDAIMEHRLRCVSWGQGDYNMNVAIDEKNQSKPGTPHAVAPPVTNLITSQFDSRMEMLIESNRQMKRTMRWLIVSHLFFFLLTIIFFASFFCFGEDLFSSYLYFPFGYCVSSSWSRRC